MQIKDAYSYPEYCDIAYSWDRTAECDFVEECIRRYADIKVNSILDIACGTGIHLREFAKRGYKVLGLDVSEEMVAFAVKKARAGGLKVECVKADMKKFRIDHRNRGRGYGGRRYGCAICMLDSFRYLLGDEDILSHLKSVASVVERGGLYILDLWMPKGDVITEWEDISWVQRDKGIFVEAAYRQYGKTFDENKRTFEDELILNIKSPGFNSTVRSRVKTRALFLKEFKGLVKRQGLFDFIGRFYNFDFNPKEGYNIKPIRSIIILKRNKEGG